MYDHMMGHVDADRTNAAFVKAVQEMEDVISYYYQGGSTHESEFWDYATQHTSARMAERNEFKEMMLTYKNLKNRGVLYTGPVYALKPLTWEIIDEQMGYGYIAS